MSMKKKEVSLRQNKSGPVREPLSKPHEKVNQTFVTAFFNHSVLTDFGRVMAVPSARFKTNCDSIPIARDTENSTV